MDTAFKFGGSLTKLGLCPTSDLSMSLIAHCLKIASTNISFQYARLHLLKSMHSQLHETKCALLILLLFLLPLIGDITVLNISVG